MIGLILALCLAPSPPESLPEFLAASRIRHLADLPLGVRVAQVGLLFQDTPYVGGTLDRHPQIEECTIVWDELDCVTFVELSWNLARLLGQQGQTDSDLSKLITETRYRDGHLNGYASRLHYTTEWLSDNARRGLLKDLSPELPGAKRDNRVINFMTENRSLYPAITLGGDAVFSQLRAHEREFARQIRFFVPRESVGVAEAKLNSGDIVGITTAKVGLDTSHVGMIVVDNEGVRHFLHASTTQNKVILDVSLSAYLARNPSATGFVAARPLATPNQR